MKSCAHHPRSMRSSRSCRVAPQAAPSRRDLFLGSGAVVLESQLPQAAIAADAAVAAAPATGGTVGTRPLTAALQISEVIKGNWQLSGGHRGSSADDRTVGSKAVADFDAFVNSGITTFDTADIYGPSEKLIGEYLRRRPEGKDGLQVLTKFCRFGNDQVTVNQKAVTSGIQGSLSRLGLDSVDLVQFYWHNYQVPKYVATAQYLMEEVAKGSIQNLGVTNFDTIRLQQMMSGGASIVSNQVQYSLLDRRPENGMTELCENASVKLLPYGTVAGGFLSEKYIGFPAEKLKFDTYSKSKYASVIQQNGGWEWFQSLLLVLQGIAVKHDVSISNVASRWVLDKPAVAGIIVGARNANHVQDHVKLMSLKLDEEDLGRIDEVLATGTQANGDCYDWERGGSW